MKYVFKNHDKMYFRRCINHSNFKGLVESSYKQFLPSPGTFDTLYTLFFFKFLVSVILTGLSGTSMSQFFEFETIFRTDSDFIKPANATDGKVAISHVKLKTKK